MVRILKEPKNSLVRQYKKLLSMDNAELEFTDEALKEIAKLATERKTGARGLRAIMEEFMLSVMYDAPDMDDVKGIIINADTVRNKTAPEYVYGEKKALPSPKKKLPKKTSFTDSDEDGSKG